MKAISIQPFWATAFLVGDKDTECRTWKTDYRGDLLICSSSRKEPGCVAGHALMVAELKDIVPFTKRHLESAFMDEMPKTPSYAWIFDNFRVVKPTPIKGKLHLYDVTEDKIEILMPWEDLDEEAARALYSDLIYKPEHENTEFFWGSTFKS